MNLTDWPLFWPDATRAVVRSVASGDLQKIGMHGVVVNIFHLAQTPGVSVIKDVGGIKKWMHWDGLVASDSGGFQLLSLIYRDKKLGSISNEGLVYRGGGRNLKLTPEKSIQMQMAIGSDVLVCLDDCPAQEGDEISVRVSVERTIAWAKRCRESFDQECELRHINNENRPLLIAPIHGGKFIHLRQYCAQALLEIGFDGFGFGGWPLTENREVDMEQLEVVAQAVAGKGHLWGLGVGYPDALVRGSAMGYTMFDCAMPTRDARHGRLYVWNADPLTLTSWVQGVWSHVSIMQERYVRDTQSIDPTCDCELCVNYSRSYLRHLMSIEDSAAWRLATIHNLRFYVRLGEVIHRLKHRL